jgi:multidrug efflux system membrane fusion protein
MDPAEKFPVPAPAVAAPHRPPPSRKARFIGTLIALIVLAALAWLVWFLWQRQVSSDAAPPGGPGPGGGRPPATTVGVATAQRADIPVLLESLGTVTPMASVTVRPQVSGVLQKVLFREGQQVRAGEVLATIDPRPFELELLQATGQRQRDEAQLENARLTLQRYQTLLSQDSIARQDVDTQATLVKQLEGTVASDKAAEGTARLNLGYSRIVAPIGGRVGLRVVDVGNVVSAGDAAGIAVITQLSPIDVVFSVPQDLVGEIQAGAGSGKGSPSPVTALDRTRLATLETGVFSTLDNRIDTQTGTVRAKARFANPEGALFPNQFVNVRLLLRTVKDAVVVPVTALRHGSDGDFVYVLDRAEKTVALRPVKRDRATADQVAITSGLRVGEEVITEGADRLKDGARVALPGDRPRQGDGAGGRGGKRRGADGAASGAASSASRPASAPPQARASAASAR